MIELVASNLSVTAGDDIIVRAANITLRSGELVALLGPNGAGKTSLLRAVLGLYPPSSGEAQLGGDDMKDLSASARARRVSYLPQARPLAWPNRVYDVVGLGRFAHGVAIGGAKGEDAAAIDRALIACDIVHLSDRSADTLSGGELARVHCARALAAETPLLVADEPVAALDPRHQFRVMDLIRRYVDDGGGALVVLHDVGLAARYSDRLIWMKAGEIIADGRADETLTPQRLAEVYGVRARVSSDGVVIKGAL